ncbi:D-2-hydroxyacid dehydrogenase family protein [Saccharibacillus sp. CPCC 101409]|uniref:D-2-hydroxyacid dehydrogenase family protein n=1 Tax=Saccharibacillus sp. CPCC 101409 TaxID=3058041 RepID=UPI002671E989|nr:D-2-hydroxyacid dehydrogenase family protein [Saccharibacillus sp. CPCC 101409]MDO3409422.1 D-2-hydroxyacid dehydrogenase family protein [Saccharibacillus sp. CPCC 101409]
MPERCAVLDDYQGVSLRYADWSALQGQVDITLFERHIPGEEELAQALEPYSIIVAMRERTPFPASLLERLPRLKLLVTTGMRNASIDLESARKLGITVSGTGGAGAGPAELTWALILGLSRQLELEQRNLRENGPWQSVIGRDLSGRRLGLLGLGKIGLQAARIGQAFGMDVSAWSQNLTEEQAGQAGVRRVSKEELLRESDIVSIHLVLSERTRGLLGAAELALLKPEAYLINTSRAAIVDQEALIDALRGGRIAGAGLDVFDTEPLPADHPYRSLPNVLATPHIGYVTEESYRVFYTHAVENIEAYLSGRSLRVLNE